MFYVSDLWHTHRPRPRPVALPLVPSLSPERGRLTPRPRRPCTPESSRRGDWRRDGAALRRCPGGLAAARSPGGPARGGGELEQPRGHCGEGRSPSQCRRASRARLCSQLSPMTLRRVPRVLAPAGELQGTAPSPSCARRLPRRHRHPATHASSGPGAFLGAQGSLGTFRATLLP